MRNIRKVAIICGSERKGGNTEQASHHAAERLRENGHDATVFLLRELDIFPCGTCGNCNWKKEPCKLDDDMANVVNGMIDSDAIIYAAPVHGFGMAHLMQIFLERAGVCFLRFNRPLENKIGDVIAIGRRYNVSHVHDQLVNNILLNRMIKAGSGYPVILHGGVPGAIFDDKEGMASLYVMLDRMSYLLSHMRPHLETLDKMPHENERHASKTHEFQDVHKQ